MLFIQTSLSFSFVILLSSYFYFSRTGTGISFSKKRRHMWRDVDFFPQKVSVTERKGLKSQENSKEISPIEFCSKRMYFWFMTTTTKSGLEREFPPNDTGRKKVDRMTIQQDHKSDTSRRWEERNGMKGYHRWKDDGHSSSFDYSLLPNHWPSSGRLSFLSSFDSFPGMCQRNISWLCAHVKDTAGGRVKDAKWQTLRGSVKRQWKEEVRNKNRIRGFLLVSDTIP